MNDELEQLRRQVERLTAERDAYKTKYDDTLRALAVKEWEGITQADLDAALASPFSLQHYIDLLEAPAPAEARGG